MRLQSHVVESIVSGVGVLDKSILILGVLRESPMQLAELVDATGFSRATAYRLAAALEAHGLLRRTPTGHFALGLDLIALGRSASEQFPMTEAAAVAMSTLRDTTGESVQLYVKDGENRVCIAALESPHGLRTIVAVGEILPMDRGSAGRVLAGETGAVGWVESAGEREPGVASVSAPVVGPDGTSVLAAVSVSGPIDRMGRHPGRNHGLAVGAAAAEIELALEGS